MDAESGSTFPSIAARPLLDRAMDELSLDASVVGQLQDLVIDSEDVSGFLEDLAVFTASSVSAARGQDVLCGITLSRRRRSMTVAGSSHEARLIDEVQQAYGDGPCLEAMRTGKSVLVSDTSADSQWPEYCTTIAERGHLAVLCVPLRLEEVRRRRSTCSPCSAMLSMRPPSEAANNSRARQKRPCGWLFGSVPRNNVRKTLSRPCVPGRLSTWQLASSWAKTGAARRRPSGS